MTSLLILLSFSIASVIVLDRNNGGGCSVATFAGGCFWCMEPPFERLKGVLSVTSGFTGGHEAHSTYDDVSSGRTGHLEAVRVVFRSSIISYNELLDVFWRQIDPTDPDGQFADRGTQYRTAIFCHDDIQTDQALKSKLHVEASGRFSRPVVTEIKSAAPFFEAEPYHQDFYKKFPVRYKTYRWASGRQNFIQRVWRDNSPYARWDGFIRPSDEELRRRLTALQYHVTHENGTEHPFRNAFWNQKASGIYVDLVSGTPLFTSRDKFDSGSGWPSFSRPVVDDNIVLLEDSSNGMIRTEVRSRHADTHLGHLFDDGPAPTGLRYCINSSALRFIPASELKANGYEAFEALLDGDA